MIFDFSLSSSPFLNLNLPRLGFTPRLTGLKLVFIPTLYAMVFSPDKGRSCRTPLVHSPVRGLRALHNTLGVPL